MATDLIELHHPIILIHGLGARSVYGPVEYFYGLGAHLRKAGNRLLIPSLSPWASIDRRANQLKEQIQAAFPDPETRINLIGHSMGGLDARYLASCLGFGNRIVSITTVGTPNRGTIAADCLMDFIPSNAISKFVRGRALKKLTTKLLDAADVSPDCFKQVSNQYCSEYFATQAPNVPGVAYFSATTVIQDPLFKNALPIFWASHGLVKKHEGDNDGFVSLESSRWGEHICTEYGDHYAQIGHFMGRCRGLDYLGFYDRILMRLKQERF